jgi:hypothetical protein
VASQIDVHRFAAITFVPPVLAVGVQVGRLVIFAGFDRN